MVTEYVYKGRYGIREQKSSGIVYRPISSTEQNWEKNVIALVNKLSFPKFLLLRHAIWCCDS
jgi:hypothetical protein